MSLQAILDAIRASSDAQVREIEAATEAEVQKIMVQDQAETKRLRQEAYAAASAPGAAERARILGRARLKAQRILSEAREDLIDDAIDQARKRLASIRDDPIYPAILRQLTEEALANLEGSLGEAEKPQLAVDPRDQQLLESILSNMGLDLPVSGELDCWGGIIAKSDDSHVIVVNTLEGRLTRAMPYLCRCLSALIEEDQPKPSTDQFKVTSEV
ncbi:MAG: hypothetical protein E3J37_05960 [Anaerolineales bacterium]|nr:MAG: hypothetical protein E3J37_05960 [Anaerolineales bacterium]